MVALFFAWCSLGIFTMSACTLGDSSDQSKNSSQHSHSFNITVVEPTCLYAGYERYTCSCGESYNTNYTSRLGHDLKVQSYTSSTCIAKGMTEYQCSRCDYSEQKTLDMVDHSYEGNLCTKCGNLAPTEGIAYELSADGEYYIVTGLGTCTQTEIVLASSIEGLPVTQIAPEAFMGEQSLLDVFIPSSVTEIGTSAFKHCDNLLSITFGGYASSEWAGYSSTEKKMGLNPGNASVAATVLTQTFYFYRWVRQ
jgi:hypothetical protein